MAKRGMMDQFFEIKEQTPGTILFFRMGDFYELFYEDAEVASEVLGLSLTARDKKAENPIPMAGFPWHQLDEQLKTMLRAGFKVTVADQEEELREGAKLLERVVTRIYTPGSLYEDSLIPENENSGLCSLSIVNDSVGFCYVDSSTGLLRSASFRGANKFERCQDEILKWQPSELVISPKDSEDSEFCSMLKNIDNIMVSHHTSSSESRKNQLKKMLEVSDLGSIDADSSPEALDASGLAADYLSKMQNTDFAMIRDVELIEDGANLQLDQTTLRNLEIIQTLNGDYDGSLLGSMRACRTAMGRRCLKRWLLNPLRNASALKSRHDSVGKLMRSSRRLETVRELLKGIRDMERLAIRLSHGRADGRDLVAIADAVMRLPNLKETVSECEDELLNALIADIDILTPLATKIQTTLVDNPPLTVKEGGLIIDGFDEELDELRRISREGKSWFSALERTLREDLDIPSLKVKHNRQIGWFIEVTKSNLSRVPEDWIRKQEMTNGSRYLTQELVERDRSLLTSETKSKSIEYAHFLELRSVVADSSELISSIADRVAAIDVLQCFAKLSSDRNWCRPEIMEDENILLKEVRHPVIELSGKFVPNDICFDKNRRYLLITGPNMGGKSTYLRCAALAVIMAQAGCYVAAKKAKIGLVDRIFTRVGASDDIKRGRSTFMMEMIEVAHILKRATDKSLILLDEIGRGTSTFDGLSIAWSVTEDIANRLSARTLFATHYHQLIGLEQSVPGLVNAHLEVAQKDGKLVFMHTVTDGACDDSYGIQVAALAGLPTRVVERASDLLQFLEQQASSARAGENDTPHARDAGQASLMRYYAAAAMNSDTPEQPKPSPVESKLKVADVDSLSPRQALDLLYELKNLLGDD